MDQSKFCERLLGIMERKQHWAWPAFTSGMVPKERLHIHFEQEYATYVRDFPVMLGYAYVQCPVPDARRALAENLYEEETGGLAAGRPHPELFLHYPRGLGMDLARFEHVRLLPSAARYRALLDECTQERGWETATVVTTIFLEGTPYERGELDPKAAKKPEPPLEEHPLVKHYGLRIDDLSLTKAHRKVEGSHRKAAWHIVLELTTPAGRAASIDMIERVLECWLEYRDAVATACGIRKLPDGSPARIDG